jgi:spore maturation protein B
MSKIILPIFVLIIISYGLKKHDNVYESFLSGVKEGLSLSLNIIPALIAMVFAVNIFLDSNFLPSVLNIFSDFFSKFHIPIAVMPMAFLRPISGSATLAILTNIYQTYGPDSYIGNLASVIQGCTDTTIYVLALYFSSIKIKNIRYSLWVGLFADLIGIIMAFLLSSWLFS